MDAGKLENTLKLLTAMTIANKNAVHTLILQRARRGEITKRELGTWPCPRPSFTAKSQKSS